MVLHRPTIVFTIRFFPLFKPSNNEHSSLRRVYSPNICSCHSFNSIFGYLHKMTHNLMKLLQPRKWENYWGPIITCNLQFRQHSITTSNGHHKPSLQNTESWIRSFPGSVRGDFIDNPPKVKKKDLLDYNWNFSWNLTSEILRKWPLLLLPRSKKNLFWSTLITFDTAMLPISSCGGSSTDLSTFSSEVVTDWLLCPDMKPAPTSSESPTRRSEVSELCCCGRHKNMDEIIISETPSNKLESYFFLAEHM